MAAEDSTIFTAMKNSVNDRARQLDGVFSAQGLTQDSPGIRNEAKWALNEENRLRIDFISCKATLFDMPAMTKVVWGRIAMSNVSVDKSVGLIVRVLSGLFVKAFKLWPWVLMSIAAIDDYVDGSGQRLA